MPGRWMGLREFHDPAAFADTYLAFVAENILNE